MMVTCTRAIIKVLFLIARAIVASSPNGGMGNWEISHIEAMEREGDNLSETLKDIQIGNAG